VGKRRSKMSDELIPSRVYEVRLLDIDLQREGEDRFLAEDVRVSTAGILEANRIYIDSPRKEKVFFSGKFFITEMSQEHFKMLKEEGGDCGHDHGDEETEE
jgi:hypothetical protein